MGGGKISIHDGQIYNFFFIMLLRAKITTWSVFKDIIKNIFSFSIRRIVSPWSPQLGKARRDLRSGSGSGIGTVLHISDRGLGVHIGVSYRFHFQFIFILIKLVFLNVNYLIFIFRHIGLLEDLGKLWGHLKEGYGRLISFYCKLLGTS